LVARRIPELGGIPGGDLREEAAGAEEGSFRVEGG
jgi:hypothetical protein